MKKKLRLSVEYMTTPIFDIGMDYGPIELSELPISHSLVNAIETWDQEYQATFNADYPPDSCFPSKDAEIKHNEEGKLLATALQEELGSNYFVEYKAYWD